MFEERIEYLDRIYGNREHRKRLESIKLSLLAFLAALPSKPTLSNMCAEEVRNFLIWKDKDGKTKVHLIQCPFLGNPNKLDCSCPKRMAIASVRNLVQNLASILEDAGRGKIWNCQLFSGNPARSPIITIYLRQIAKEQASAHVLPKQAIPIFASKIRRLSMYIDSELSVASLPVKRKFILLRDQAFFKLLFFAGDRASDLANVPSQEVKRLDDDTGFVFCHTLTKTIRGGKGRSNTFVIKRCKDVRICPVAALERYVSGAKAMGVDLSRGYLFRTVSESGSVLDQQVSYNCMYERFKQYLVDIGIYEGETLHSLRAGCAVTLGLSGSVSNPDQMMNHVGWFTETSAAYYSRVHALKDSSFVAENLAVSASHDDEPELMYNRHANQDLERAFMS